MKDVGATEVSPALFYRDPKAAVEWLVKYCGFEAGLLVPGSDGNYVHAELKLGNSWIMLGSAKTDLPWQSPLQLGGVTQTVYMFVQEIDAYYERVRAAGAKFEKPIYDTNYGSREFAIKDPKGTIGVSAPIAQVTGNPE